MKTDRIIRPGAAFSHHMVGVLPRLGAILHIPHALLGPPRLLRAPPTTRAHVATALLAMLGLSAIRTDAATNLVTSLDDTGVGSLRQAIADAVGGDMITFGVTGTVTLTSGELALDKDLTILGPGLTNLTVSGNQVSRVLKVSSGITALISGLTIRDGKVPDGPPGTVVEGWATPGGPGESGGAIHTAGALTMHDCRVTANAAGHGGPGIGSDLIGVSAGGDGGSGGGIYNSGTLSLSNCVVDGNSAGDGGVSGSGWTFSPRSGAGGQGGGIYNTGTLWLENSIVSGNTAGRGGDTPMEAAGGNGGGGGGIWSSGSVAAIRSTISENVAGDGGHGGYDSLDGGDGGGGGSGGGVYSAGTLTLTNCTVSGNAAGSAGGGGSGYFGHGGAGGNGGSGGGLCVDGQSSLSSCTVSGNSSGQGGSGGSGYGAMGPPIFAPDGLRGEGGGVFNEIGASALCLNTLVASNTGASPDTDGAFTSLGHNLVGITNGSSGFGSNGDMMGSNTAPFDARTGSLTDNGGPTLTMALLPGSPAIDAGGTAAEPATDQRGLPRPIGLAADIGAYEVQVHYVSPLSLNPIPPYDSWGSAATNIQNAMDSASAGDLIVVSNGVYSTGGRAAGGALSRVVVEKPVTLQSINGPEVTVIHGSGFGRCAYLVDGSLLAGFTLTGGILPDGFGDGAGVWCESQAVVITNCMVTNNHVYRGNGGGAYSGTLINCALSQNGALTDSTFPSTFAGGLGGGAYQSILTNCILTGNHAQDFGVAGYGEGGGAWGSKLSHCTLVENSANRGGGAIHSVLNNCLLNRNSATKYGGGAADGTLNSSTLVANHAPVGGGSFSCSLRNCIVFANTRTNIEGGGVVEYCCTTSSGGVGNITNAPLFVDYGSGNLRLQSTSPCINAGNNAYVTSSTDLDGFPRIVGGTVDIGAYEFQSPASSLSYAWLQQYGLPTDGSVDAVDVDCDGLNTWQEWRCQTCPTNMLSVLRLLSAMPKGNAVTVRWQSVPGVNYLLERSTNLGLSSFTPLATGIPGQPGTTTFTDTNASSASALFYRVGVGNY